MNLSKLLVPLAGCAVASATLGGCTFAVDGAIEPPSPPPVVLPSRSGTLTVTWLVVGTSDRALCAAWGARAVELAIFDSAGTAVTTVNAPCSDFSVRLSLPEGRYSADATLIGPRSNPISTTRRLNRIDIIAGTDLAIDLNFPRESIL
jgi:hypothetical protein